MIPSVSAEDEDPANTAYPGSEARGSSPSREMRDVVDISKVADREGWLREYLDKLTNLKPEVISAAEGSSKLRLTIPDMPPMEIELVKVEGGPPPRQTSPTRRFPPGTTSPGINN